MTPPRELRRYHILSVVSLVDGTTRLRDIAERHPDKNVFGGQDNYSQDGLAICIDCNSTLDWESYYSVDPQLSEFVFDNTNRPSYLPEGCHNLSHQDCNNIVTKNGDLGMFWLPVVDLGGN